MFTFLKYVAVSLGKYSKQRPIFEVYESSRNNKFVIMRVFPNGVKIIERDMFDNITYYSDINKAKLNIDDKLKEFDRKELKRLEKPEIFYKT